MKSIDKTSTVSIIGAGSWGTAVAMAIAESKPHIQVRMWAYEKSVASSINRKHVNNMYLPGISLPRNIFATTSVREALLGTSAVMISTPSKVVYDTCLRIGRYIDDDIHIGYLSKGFFRIGGDVLTMSQTITRALPSAHERVTAIYGPSHAEEVSHRFHTCLLIAGHNEETRNFFNNLLTCEYLQCRESTDILGTDVGATLKNPAAIAAGMISVLPGCGYNLTGALISEALNEMLKLAEVFKASPETIIGIAGLGDLVATALSDHSRNRRFGKDIARQIMQSGGRMSIRDRLMLRLKPEQVIEKMSQKLHYLAEGAYAIEPLIELAEEKNISIPVYRSLYEVLLNKKNPSLLIETIKNPDKFSELYSATKIHVKGKKRGMERVQGTLFSERIIRQVTSRLLADKGSPDATTAYRTDIITMLKRITEQSPYPEKSSFFRDESRIIARMTVERYPEIITSLVKHYVNRIPDRFNPAFYFLFNAYFALQRILLSLKGLESDIQVSGKIGAIRKKSPTSNIVYVCNYRSHLDFIPLIQVFLRNRLPLPRFFVSGQTIGTGIRNYLLRRAGAYCVDVQNFHNPVYRLVLSEYLGAMLEHGVPILFFPEISPSVDGTINLINEDFFTLLSESLYKNTVEILIVPVEISYPMHPFHDSSNGNLTAGALLGNPINVNISNPIHLSEYTCDPENLREMAAIVRDTWLRDAIILPHNILSHILLKEEGMLDLRHADEHISRFLAESGLKINMSPKRILKTALRVLKKNHVVDDRGGKIRVISMGDIQYYSNQCHLDNMSKIMDKGKI